jgi:hypothetical protein
MQARRSALMQIYKKKYDAGRVKIPLNRQGINAKGIPLVLFFGFDSQISSPMSCGGDEMWISDPNSGYFKGCKESSSYADIYKCRSGLNGKNKDGEGSMWVTLREGVGSWMSIDFNGLFQVSKIKMMNRRNPAERNAAFSVLWSSGDSDEFKLSNIDDVQEFKIDPPIRTNSVKFTITSVYGTINNGASIEVWGTKCIDADNDTDKSPESSGMSTVTGVNEKKMAPLFKEAEKKAISLNCKDSVSNSKKLDTIKQKPGSKVLIKCSDSCSNANVDIYGDKKYSKDSSICRSAYHSQSLKVEGGLVKLVFEQGQATYKSETRNGIKSKSKGTSELTISFENESEKDPIIVKTGSKVDLRNPTGAGWVGAIISEIKEGSEGQVLTMTIEGADSSTAPVQLPYPNKKKIKPCGDFVRNRDCEGSRSSGNTAKPIKIKFAPDTYTTAGEYQIDKGEIFGKSGKPYGWSKDMTNRMRQRYGASKPEIETLVEFPPSPKSKFCSKPSPDVICESITWAVKVGHGRFNVKLYIGDPTSNSRVDLKVNDQFIVKGKTVTKNNMEVFEGAYDSANQYLTISSDCQEDCEYAMSKISMVELYPFVEQDQEKKNEPEPEPEKADPCGNATTGGKCDTGPDVTHCLFDDASSDSAKYCTGQLMMLQVSKTYKCQSQREKYKCIKRQYKDQAECLNWCPGTCEKAACS